MKTYFLCPRTRTGGPENIHQMCDYLRSIGHDTYIYYFPNPQDEYTCTYPEFTHICIADSIEDAPTTLVIVPEIHEIRKFRKMLPKSVLALWWMSFTNACLFNVMRYNVAEHNVIHLFHSYYEYAMVRPFLSPTTPWFFASECIHDDFLQLQPDDYVDTKENIVCYNGVKDTMTPFICNILKVPCINLKNLPRIAVMEALQKSKLYIDFGFHPGKDHLPREAAMCGCVVITNKSGSAAYAEDVPIREKVLFEKDLLQVIPRMFEEYKEVYKNQEHYRTRIKEEKNIFQENARFFMLKIKNEYLLPENTIMTSPNSNA